MGDLAPATVRLNADNDAIATVGNSASRAVKVPSDERVTSVSYVPLAALSGANTNSRNLVVTNKGQAGVGAVNVATLSLTTGVNLVAFDEKVITLNGTATNLDVVAGDVLELASTAVGTGIADPGGQWEIVIDRTA